MCRTSGASNSPFTLPANVRPSVPVYVTASQFNTATGRLIILTGGDVLVGDDPDHPNSGAVFTSLSGITYNP